MKNRKSQIEDPQMQILKRQNSELNAYLNFAVQVFLSLF